MNICEIIEKLKDIEIQRKELENELNNVSDKLNSVLKEELNYVDELIAIKEVEIYKKCIMEISDTFFPEENDVFYKEKIMKIDDKSVLKMYLEEDVKSALKETKLDIDKIEEVLSKYKINDIDLEKCIENAAIRLDFETALRNAKRGTDLSSKLDYGFSNDDLLELMKLHKANKFRSKIESLLTDCNFHTECDYLSDEKYEEFEEYIKE